MSHLTSFEAKQLAAYLKASCSFVSVSLKHGQWLNAISHSDGFRDWNAMAATVPDVPETTWGQWYDVFFGVARVIVEGQVASEHFVWSRNSAISRHETATFLAQSVFDRIGKNVRGTPFEYSQPDSSRSVSYASDRDRLRRWSKFPWTPVAPIVIASSRPKITLFLWWLNEQYTMAEYYPERERRFKYQSLMFDDDGYEASLTDNFLTQLTGIARPKRKCLYVPELPNGPEDSFVPVVVQEGCRDGELTSFNFGFEREEAFDRALSLNREKGTTSSDMCAISRRFRMYEPHDEEVFEDYSHYDD